MSVASMPVPAVKSGFLAACKYVFQNTGQSVSEFAAEVKTLDPQDRADLALGLNTAGYLSDAGMQAEVAKQSEVAGKTLTPNPTYKYV